MDGATGNGAMSEAQSAGSWLQLKAGGMYPPVGTILGFYNPLSNFWPRKIWAKLPCKPGLDFRGEWAEKSWGAGSWLKGGLAIFHSCLPLGIPPHPFFEASPD